MEGREWYRGFFLERERERGLDPEDNHLYVGCWCVDLAKQPEGSATLVLTAETAEPELEATVERSGSALERRREYESWVLWTWERSRPGVSAEAPEWVRQTVLAADAFVVQRKSRVESGEKSLIAGYPWFNDWGRDTMISLPGILVTTGRLPEATEVLRLFASYLDEGLIPNNFPDSANEQPGYNTVDGTLWFVHALWSIYERTENLALLDEFWGCIQEIVSWHLRGTKHGIIVDSLDGLLRAGAPSVQLTWMDAKVGDWVVTPRHGKAVEINALWYSVLVAAARMGRILGKDHDDYAGHANQVRHSFQKFYSPRLGYLFDVIEGPEGADETLRPNQLFALTLPASSLEADELLTTEQRRQVLAAVGRWLVVAPGVRSLTPNDNRYCATFGGPPAQRDGAYHQGTAWGWLTGVYAEAHLRTYNQPAIARALLERQSVYMRAYGLGTLGEIFEGTEPYRPCGCIAQAWSVGELLRVWHLCGV